MLSFFVRSAASSSAPGWSVRLCTCLMGVLIIWSPGRQLHMVNGVDFSFQPQPGGSPPVERVDDPEGSQSKCCCSRSACWRFCKCCSSICSLSEASDCNRWRTVVSSSLCCCLPSFPRALRPTQYFGPKILSWNSNVSDVVQDDLSQHLLEDPRPKGGGNNCRDKKHQGYAYDLNNKKMPTSLYHAYIEAEFDVPLQNLGPSPSEGERTETHQTLRLRLELRPHPLVGLSSVQASKSVADSSISYTVMEMLPQGGRSYLHTTHRAVTGASSSAAHHDDHGARHSPMLDEALALAPGLTVGQLVEHTLRNYRAGKKSEQAPAPAQAAMDGGSPTATRPANRNLGIPNSYAHPFDPHAFNCQDFISGVIMAAAGPPGGGDNAHPAVSLYNKSLKHRPETQSCCDFCGCAGGLIRFFAHSLMWNGCSSNCPPSDCGCCGSCCQWRARRDKNRARPRCNLCCNCCCLGMKEKMRRGVTRGQTQLDTETDKEWQKNLIENADGLLQGAGGNSDWNFIREFPVKNVRLFWQDTALMSLVTFTGATVKADHMARWRNFSWWRNFQQWQRRSNCLPRMPHGNGLAQGPLLSFGRKWGSWRRAGPGASEQEQDQAATWGPGEQGPMETIKRRKSHSSRTRGS